MSEYNEHHGYGAWRWEEKVEGFLFELAWYDKEDQSLSDYFFAEIRTSGGVKVNSMVTNFWWIPPWNWFRSRRSVNRRAMVRVLRKAKKIERSYTARPFPGPIW